ncbi:MAG: alkaline phosphatase PhoX [Actinomycetota bacterium]|nr:alkaline phosphatase PhoX [Actinomycetota bacterium]MEC9394212.1 alkaline phosphatase PhoX [Actinomycetota bacterium]MEC9467139.1 alkaline phosphatase PhoX [Actinomycetota bacterium]MEE2957692.1 alkaline phosphatase PhoX [Actinomycetota bacterium]
MEGRSPDAHGLVLPEGFTARVVAEGGTPVAGTDWLWPLFPDGKGTIPIGDGGWLLACNHEVFDFQTPRLPHGGASTVSFDAEGRITGAWPILEGSHSNSRGAATPWGTWLSCQEVHGAGGGDGAGLIWECDPTGERPAMPRPALGVRTHGSVAVNSADGRCYLTEAHRDGRLYRFTPSQGGLASESLEAGVLEAMAVDLDSSVTWLPVADPTGTVAPTRVQAAAATVIPMGGGVAVHDETLWFTTGLDDRVHVVDLTAGRHRVAWDGMRRRRPLAGIGDLTVSPAGEVFAVEDRGDMEVVLLSPSVGGDSDGGDVARPFCRMVGDGHRFSAVTGPCFDPSGTRMYVSSLRGRGEALVRDVVSELDWGDGVEGRHVGVTYEVTGPFHEPEVVTAGDGSVGSVATTTLVAPGTTTPGTTTPATTSAAPRTTLVPSSTAPATTGPPPPTTIGPGAIDTPGDGGTWTAAWGVGAGVLAAGGAVVALRRRRGG